MTDQPPPGEPYRHRLGRLVGMNPRPLLRRPGGGSYPPPPPGGGSYPPPPPGGASYPPPPPSSGGYAPPPPGPAIRALPTESYTPWVTRVLAFIIDNIPAAVLIGIGCARSGPHRATVVCHRHHPVRRQPVLREPVHRHGTLALGLAWLVAVAYLVWNYGYRQGTTGSSIGKSVMKFKVVSEITGQPIGFGMSVVRQIRALRRRDHLLHRLPVPAVGRQAANPGGQDHDDGVPADRTDLSAGKSVGGRADAALSLG